VLGKELTCPVFCVAIPPRLQQDRQLGDSAGGWGLDSWTTLAAHFGIMRMSPAMSHAIWMDSIDLVGIWSARARQVGVTINDVTARVLRFPRRKN
jgi:hypothetical protein